MQRDTTRPFSKLFQTLVIFSDCFFSMELVVPYIRLLKVISFGIWFWERSTTPRGQITLDQRLPGLVGSHAMKTKRAHTLGHSLHSVNSCRDLSVIPAWAWCHIYGIKSLWYDISRVLTGTLLRGFNVTYCYRVENSNPTFTSWFHAWSSVHGVTKETVSWHCMSNHSCTCDPHSC